MEKCLYLYIYQVMEVGERVWQNKVTGWSLSVVAVGRKYSERMIWKVGNWLDYNGWPHFWSACYDAAMKIRKVVMKNMVWYSVLSELSSQTCLIITTRNTLAITSQHTVLHVTSDILFWCQDTENHRRNLICNFSFHPSPHTINRLYNGTRHMTEELLNK